MLQRSLSPPAILSCLLPLVTLVMLVGTVSHYQREVSKAEVGANLAFAAIEAERHAAADAPKLLRIRRKTLAELRQYSTARSASGALADMLDHLQRLGKAYGVSVIGLDTAGPSSPLPALADTHLRGEDVVLRLRGTFRNVVLFERRLSSDATLVRVESIEFSSAPAAQHRVLISSIVRAQLFYIAFESGGTL